LFSYNDKIEIPVHFEYESLEEYATFTVILNEL